MLIICYETKLSQKTGHFHEKFRFFVTFIYFFQWKTLSICLNSLDLLNAHKRQLLLGLPHQDSSFHFLHRRSLHPTTQPHNKVFHADCCMADVQAVYSLSTLLYIYIYIYIYIYNILEAYLLFVRKQMASVFTLYHFISSMALMCMHALGHISDHFMYGTLHLSVLSVLLLYCSFRGECPNHFLI